MLDEDAAVVVGCHHGESGMTRAFGTRFGRSALALSAVLFAAALLAQDGAAPEPTDEASLQAKYEAAHMAKDWPRVGSLARQLLELNPKNWEVWRGLAESQVEARQYEEALNSYHQAILWVPLSSSTKTAAGEMLFAEGNVCLKLKRIPEAIDHYEHAAGLLPEPAKAYFNLCAFEYNIGDSEKAIAYADKTIKADPKKADAYFIKGSCMFADSPLGPNGKVKALEGTADVLRKYLELSPNGPHADDVKQMLDYIK